MDNLTLEELRAIAEMRNIRGYERMSKERLITSVNELKSLKKNLMMQEQKRSKEILTNQEIEILSQKLKRLEKIFKEMKIKKQGRLKKTS